MTSNELDIFCEYLEQTTLGLPSAMIFPPSIHTTLEHMSSIAPRLWDTNTTVLLSFISFLKAEDALAEKLASPVLRTSSTSMMSAST